MTEFGGVIAAQSIAWTWYDVQVHGVIGEDGHVREASVLAGGRDDLEKQAVQTSPDGFSLPACATESLSL